MSVVISSKENIDKSSSSFTSESTAIGVFEKVFYTDYRKTMEHQQDVFSMEAHDGIIKLAFHRPVHSDAEDVAIAKEMYQAFQKTFDQFPDQRLRIFFDLSAIRSNDYYTRGRARRIYIKLFSNPQIEYIAVVVKSSFVKIFAGFYLRAIDSSGRFKMFHNPDDAWQWLETRP